MQWWSRHRDADQAGRWYDGFLELLYQLDEMPERHPLAAENSKMPFELRELHFGLGSRPTHRALFRVLTDTVEILAVYHAAQDEARPDQLL